MSESSKKHYYPFTLRIAALASNTLCGDSAYFYVMPPDDALTIENCFVHLNLTFDSGVASANRVLNHIGIANNFPLIGIQPTYLRKFDLNQAADANRKIDLKIDLTSLLNSDAAGFINSDSGTNGTPNYVIIKVADANFGVTTVATINLWKVECLYTTAGIH